MAFKVFVDDNFHYMDASERCEQGSYDTHEAAVGVCKTIVDSYLAAAYKPGMSAEHLAQNYQIFGEDPWVSPTPEGKEKFSAWSYAESRCKEICGAA